MDEGRISDELRQRVEARHQQDRVLEPGALRALGHPLRIRIYNILNNYGPQTASSLAERLGESSGSTSYHLRALAKYDLIREVEGKGNARERWWERPAGGVALASPETMRSPAGRAASQLVTAEFFRQRQEQVVRFVDRAHADEPQQWQDASLISTASVRLTPEQSRELTLRIMAIIDETVDAYRDQTGATVRPVTIRADIFPLPENEG